jgi:hypothetical protein
LVTLIVRSQTRRRGDGLGWPLAMSSIGDVQELDPIAEDEERRLEDENAADDALQFLVSDKEQEN